VNAEELTAEECDELVRGDHANCPPACVFLRAISTIDALRTQLAEAEARETALREALGEAQHAYHRISQHSPILAADCELYLCKRWRALSGEGRP
jgi:hypothetical protein